MIGPRITKRWLSLDVATIEALPAQLGVYQLGDADGAVIKIGYAGGNELFGLRSALHRELESRTASEAAPARFRYEFNHGYLTRYSELLMVHCADHGQMPIDNDPSETPAGRLSPPT